MGARRDAAQSVVGRRQGRQAKKERLAEKRESEKAVREEILEVSAWPPPAERAALPATAPAALQ